MGRIGRRARRASDAIRLRREREGDREAGRHRPAFRVKVTANLMSHPGRPLSAGHDLARRPPARASEYSACTPFPHSQLSSPRKSSTHTRRCSLDCSPTVRVCARHPCLNGAVSARAENATFLKHGNRKRSCLHLSTAFVSGQPAHNAASLPSGAWDRLDGVTSSVGVSARSEHAAPVERAWAARPVRPPRRPAPCASARGVSARSWCTRPCPRRP
jgi:hypothetical protein